MRSKETLSLLLISAGSLTYEISLTRIFAVQQFYNFAFIVIGLAVLGFAASGLALALISRSPRQAILSAAFAISATLAYVTINFLPFDSFSIIWDPKQVWILLIYFLAAGVPFFFAGWFIGYSLSLAGTNAHLPYAINLVGAALGCLVALMGLQLVGEQGAIGIAITLGWLAMLLSTSSPSRRILLLIPSLLASFAFLYPPTFFQLRLSPYKPLSIASQFPNAQIILQDQNAAARADVLAGGAIHSFPGLSLNAPVPNIQQIGLFLDGEGPYSINQVDLQDQTLLEFSKFMPSNIAYRLRPEANTLIIDPGTGLSSVIALASGARAVSMPVDQPLIPTLLEGSLREPSGELLFDSRLHLIRRSSRSVLGQQGETYDIIEWALSDPFRPIASGAFSLSENFLLTKEAFQHGWRRLTPEGVIMITRWIGTPPAESARTWSTIVHALKAEGLTTPDFHLVAFRSMRTMTILVNNQVWNQQELDVIRGFLKSNHFDAVYLPDLEPGEVNRFNRLPEPVYAELFKDLLHQPQATIANYDFRLEPSSDDRPFFFHFFRWSQSSEVLASLGILWQPFGGSGYLVILAMFALMLLLSIPIMILPWIYSRRRTSDLKTPVWIWLYFGGLGMGFMFVEIALILRLGVLLDYPVVSFGLVLFTLLLSSGIGSRLSKRVPLRTSLGILLVLLLVMTLFLQPLIDGTVALPLWARILVSVALLIPSGVCMGVPFATGLNRLERLGQGLIPWAWAVNGATSGLSGVLATLALLDLGFRLSFSIGLACYAIVLGSTFLGRIE
jgi:hypothetical protein